MVRAALLGDVHANLPALEAVLADARRQEAEAIWNAGDLVGYNAFPDEVVSLLRASGVVSVTGNYDHKVLKFPRKAKRWRRRKQPEKWLAFRWAWKHLSDENRDYLNSLPREVRLEIAGYRVLVVHRSPAASDEFIDDRTPLTRLREVAALARADVVVVGHSHRPFARQVDGVWLINTGSVGRSDDGDPRAAYALADFDREGVRVRHLRIAYDVERAAAAILRHGLPPAFAEMVRQGRSLDAIASCQPGS